MAIQTALVAGAYTSTFNAVALGLTNDGFTLTQDAKAELIQQSDQYGDSILDGIFRGGNAYVDCECKTFVAGSVTPFWPYGGGTLGVLSTTAVPVGAQLSTIAKALVLSVIASTSASGTTPQINTFTASLAILPPDANLKLLFTSKLRMVPLRFLLLPTLSSGVTTWWIPS